VRPVIVPVTGPPTLTMLPGPAFTITSRS
jgi:hypothetical protein